MLHFTTFLFYTHVAVLPKSRKQLTVTQFSFQAVLKFLSNSWGFCFNTGESKSSLILRMAHKDEPPAMCGHVAARFTNYVFVFGGEDNRQRPLPLHEIWMYNLYTEYWRKHVISSPKLPPPMIRHPCAVTIGRDIYLFGGWKYNKSCSTNALWKLTITSTGCFNWSKIKFDDKTKTPSPRYYHSGWEHLGKLWTFGGVGKSPNGYLVEHGQFNLNRRDNNQLLCFDPSKQDWTDVKSSGTIPDARSVHSTTITGEKVWLYGGYVAFRESDDLYQLNLSSLVWTQIKTCGQLKPQRNFLCSLTVVTDTQLILYGGVVEVQVSTWILDIPSLTWRKHSIQDNKQVYWHTGTEGVNGTVIIIGGRDRLSSGQLQKYQIIYTKREPKSLQQLAMKTIYYYKDVMPWNSLPKRLAAQILFPGIIA